MALSVTRSRRSNAGNRWAEALAAAQLENGDVPDPDAEVSGEEFFGKEEEDVFESDFESTDEEEYAKEGVKDGEKQIMIEEREERRAARVKASKSVAAPVQRMLQRATKGEPAKKKRKVVTKTDTGKGATKASGESFMWDATRQSRRTSTVKHKAQVRERLKDAEKRKAHIVKRPRKPTISKTQDELIAAALELEEKNTKSLKEFLVKEEEKRAAARRVVRMKIEGPLVRWVSRAEDVKVRNEAAASTTAATTPSQSHLATVNGLPQQLARSPLSQSTIALPPRTDSTQTFSSSAPPQTTATVSPVQSASHPPVQPQGERVSVTPAPTVSSQRMQVYVEIPRRSTSTSQRPPHSTSSPLASQGSNPELSSQLTHKASTLLLQPPASPSLVRSASLSRSLGEHLGRSGSSGDPLSSIRPNIMRQASVSSTSSTKSRMVMYVELPAPKSGRIGTPTPVLAESKHEEAVKKVPDPPPKATVASPRVRNIDNDLFPPGGPNFAIVLPQRRSITSPHKTERQARNYVVVELSNKERASFGARMRAVFGDHADWGQLLVSGIKPNSARATPVCAITGLDAPYRDPRTGIPYANAHAYKTLTRLLNHEFVWSKEKGCYVGDEGKNAARGVPSNWASVASGRP